MNHICSPKKSHCSALRHIKRLTYSTKPGVMCQNDFRFQPVKPSAEIKGFRFPVQISPTLEKSYPCDARILLPPLKTNSFKDTLSVWEQMRFSKGKKISTLKCVAYNSTGTGLFALCYLD